ncbi:hypothetical protein BDZ89DRAFT_1107845 [Hymenopellis radicata]|nr:hypothetical protein BDZ89DRAFT_1107845 [Hymenopellis radicata]
MAENPLKTYVDRATQTDPALPPDTDIESTVTNPSEPARDRDHAKSSILESSSLARHLQKPHFTFNGPSVLASTLTSRVVSLPETTPPVKIKAGSKQRVVSLTDCKTFALADQIDDSTSSHCPETSISTELSQTSSDSSLHYSGSRRSRHLAMPQTPSPPSSPESVMIIGNDVQVPESFLNQKHTAVKPSMFREENGWMTWATSPPRPIPALHGPLSLPYARCPSGAEGTVIEGEDFSRVVWGLGANASSNEPSVEPDHIKSSIPVEKRERHHSNTVPCVKRVSDSYSSGTAGGPNPAKQRLLRRDAISHSPLISNQTQTLIGRTLSGSAAAVKDSEPYSSLGLSFSEPPRHFNNSNSRQQKDPFFLRTSPAVRDCNLSQITSPHIFIDSRENPGRTSQVIIPSGPRMSALDIAQQYRLKQQIEKVLLTPPDSTKPELWSPHLSQLDLRDLATTDSSYFDTLRHTGNGAYRDPDSQHSLDSHHAPQPLPVSDYYTDPSQELRDFVFNQITSPQLPIRRVLFPRMNDRLTMIFSNAYIPPSPTSPDVLKILDWYILANLVLSRLLVSYRRLSAVPEEDESKQLSPAARERRSRSSFILDLGQQAGDKTRRPPVGIKVRWRMLSLKSSSNRRLCKADV